LVVCDLSKLLIGSYLIEFGRSLLLLTLALSFRSFAVCIAVERKDFKHSQSCAKLRKEEFN